MHNLCTNSFNTPQRKQNLKLHHMTPLNISMFYERKKVNLVCNNMKDSCMFFCPSAKMQSLGSWVIGLKSSTVRL